MEDELDGIDGTHWEKHLVYESPFAVTLQFLNLVICCHEKDPDVVLEYKIYCDSKAT